MVDPESASSESSLRGEWACEEGRRGGWGLEGGNADTDVAAEDVVGEVAPAHVLRQLLD